MKNLELIHCYQHLLSNPANICWARQCTQALCVASSECLLTIPSPPVSLGKVLGICWLSPNTDRYDHQKTCSLLLGPLLVHLSAVSFENVLKNRCLPLNTDFLGTHCHIHMFHLFHSLFFPQVLRMFSIFAVSWVH